MSVLQVANIHLESTANNRIQSASGGMSFFAGGANVAGVNSTAFVIGNSSITANGYSWMPNGLLMQWGTLIVNTVSSASFSQTFPTAVLSVTVTPIGTSLVGANTPRVITTNTSVANITSATTLTTNTAYYLAIGY